MKRHRAAERHPGQPRQDGQRVLDAISRTGHSANPVAQRLAKGRNQIVGVFTYDPVFPRRGADFYNPFLVGIGSAPSAQAESLSLRLITGQVTSSKSES